jgi:polynucleotide 5'-kinase involved in rRNA processing
MTIAIKELAGRTVLAVGGPGAGKTALLLEIARELAEEGPVALVSADMGQQSLGVPTCMGLSLQAPHDRPSAMWFVGDVSPAGNLLPAVVGTARLAGRARAEGARTVLIDTTGMVNDGVGCALKYHKALATGADCIVALERNAELQAVIAVLSTVCPTIHRAEVRPEARDRTVEQRTAFRQERYQAYFREANVVQVDSSRLIGANWSSNPLKKHDFPAPGTVVGLLDSGGFCLGIGLVEKILPTRLAVHTPWPDPATVASLKLGKIRLDRQAGYAETREAQRAGP